MPTSYGYPMRPTPGPIPGANEGQGLGSLMAIMLGGRAQQAENMGKIYGQMAGERAAEMKSRADLTNVIDQIKNRQNQAQENLPATVRQYMTQNPNANIGGSNVSPDFFTNILLSGGGNANALGSAMAALSKMQQGNAAVGDQSMDAGTRARIMAMAKAHPTVAMGTDGMTYDPYAASPAQAQVNADNPVAQSVVAKNNRGAATPLSPLAQRFFQTPVLDKNGNPVVGLDGQPIHQQDNQMAGLFLQFWQHMNTVSHRPVSQDEALSYFQRTPTYTRLLLNRAIGGAPQPQGTPMPGNNATANPRNFSQLWTNP